ncbi:hypothetical protein [Actinoplanes sp. NPDC020271]|uniref:hypothetical protein n=1 Tax=Actinoplanes sp. NPDC020271 TaxID=3363896 RepID=UPI0037BB75A9
MVLVTVAYWITLHRAGLPLAVKLTVIGLYLLTLIGWHRMVTGMPRQRPRRLRSGDLRIPDVPIDVAEQWIERNPGVTATDEPIPLPHSRRYYAGWSIGLVTAAIILVVVLVTDNREDFILFWTLAPVLFVAGVAVALKTQLRARDKPKYTLLG